MDISEVIEKFAILSGLRGDDISPWVYICEDSVEEIRGRLREGVDESKHNRELCAAAAALSFYKYVLCMSIRDDISEEHEYMSHAFTKDLASTIWARYKSAITKLIIDNKFEFRGII